MCEIDGDSGAVNAVNTFGADGLLSRRSDAGGDVFYTFDPFGNVAQRLDGSKDVASSGLYDAFGQGQSTASAPDVSGYGGQWGYYTDAGMGLVLCTHRYYDPDSGSFLTRDPCDYDGGINLYAYCQNNPVNLTDAIGLMPSAQPGCKESAAIRVLL